MTSMAAIIKEAIFLTTRDDDVSMHPLLKMLFLITTMDDVSVVCYFCFTSISNNTCFNDVISAYYWNGHNNNASTDDVNNDALHVLKWVVLLQKTCVVVRK